MRAEIQLFANKHSWEESHLSGQMLKGLSWLGLC